MIRLGVTVAILQADEILLIKREDFEVWCMPGGMIDNYETVAEAAKREVFEETGLTIKLTKLVGVYSRVGTGGFDLHSILLTASTTMAARHTDSNEVLDLRYFPMSNLPEDMFWWHKHQVVDIFKGQEEGFVCTHRILPPIKVNSRAELYSLRGESRLSRKDFYKYYFEHNGLMVTEVDIPPK